MSHWPHAGPGTTGNPPPLPPRNDGHGLVPTPDAVPRPALPPRPVVGVQRESVPISGVQRPSSYNQNGQPANPGHSTTPHNAGYQQYQPGNPDISGYRTAGHSDISHLFPGGKIPPPPPLPASSTADKSPRTAPITGSPSTSVAPSVSEPALGSPSGLNARSSQVQGAVQQTVSTQNTPTPRDSWQHVDSKRDTTPSTNTYKANHNPPRQPYVQDEGSEPTAYDDVAAINESLLTMRLENSSETTPSYSSQPSSNTAPSIPRKVPSQTQQSIPQSPPSGTPTGSTTQESPTNPPPKASTSNATPNAPPTQSGAAARECISSNVTFAATWYTHSRAPDFPICESCYENQIRRSPFAGEFKRTYHDDGKPRALRVEKPTDQGLSLGILAIKRFARRRGRVHGSALGDP
ncbi:hypothetical protein NPX13_g9417 [Xylaria arbuscula]|uniref:Uncharacterized protein n=1 Tax=Xylaria arbuscula TaxID=114810 RepID=A0A9W8N6S1_9PEZI|nr:hypothetical protein NPX13_g9417 [Xylaria arbuscula]